MQRDSFNNRKTVVTAVAAMALAIPFGGVAIAQDQGKGDERPQTAPGQEKKAENAAPQSAHSENGNGYGAGKSEKPAKPAKPGKPAKPARPARPGVKPAKRTKRAKPAKPANPHAKAGKTTICHATGSATNPYVAITISDNALKAHARHQDGEDIIPAPAGGCPKGEEKPAAAKPETARQDGHGHEKVTICHATGSDTNPYVKITVAEPAVEAHRRHQDGRDIIPAPEGDCPAAAAAPAAKRAALGFAAPTGLLPAPAAVLVPRATVGGEASLPQGGVLGETASGGVAPASGGVTPAAATAPRTVTRESGADAGVSASLPFTGLDAWVLLVAGVAALLAGVAMRRASVRRTAA